MARITCRTPSTGKIINYTKTNVPTNFETIAEAPDFSIPDPSGTIASQFIVDPVDSSRAIRPGEVFFLTPLAARNKSQESQEIEVRVVLENSFSMVIAKVQVPAGDTALIPLQGRSLLKRNLSGIQGDQLQVKAAQPSVFDVWISGEEKLSAEHIGQENI